MTFQKTQDFKKEKRNQEKKKGKIRKTLMLLSIDKIKLVIMRLAYW